MSNPFAVIEGFFVGLFKAIFTPGQAKSLETEIVNFVKTDVGGLAVDAVQWAATAIPTADPTGVLKRDAAKAKLITDAKAAGKDLETLGASTLNLFIELAVAAVQAKLVVV